MIDIQAVIDRVSYPGYTFLTRQTEDGWLVWAKFEASCTVKGGPPVPWTARKWYVSQHSCLSEVVGTLLKLVLTSVEHEARENFRFAGITPFDPHLDVMELGKLSARGAFDVRPA